MTIFAPAVGSLWRQLEDAGLDPAPLFTRYGVDVDAVGNPDARVSASRIDRICADAIDRLKDPFFGMREADYFMPTHIGALGFAWLASTNLEAALKRLERYGRVINDRLRIDLSEDATDTVVTIMTDEPSLKPYHRDTGSLAILVRMCRFLCGDDWHPRRVCLAHPEPAETAYLFGYFRCPVEFDADGNRLHIDTRQARERSTGANEHLARLNDHIVVRYLAHRSRGDIVNRTRVAILDSLGDGTAAEKAVAERVHLSPRQLNRRLKAEGTSFKRLLLECRRELAEQYINDSSMSLTEISYLLGFSEASSFSRAYRRWTGVPPSAARDHAAAAQPL